MNCTIGTVFCCAAFLAAVSLSTTTHAQTTPFTKTQIADRIRKVEDGVDQFRKYLESRGGDAKDRAESAQSSGATTRRSEEHTSELQSLRHLVCRLLLEKKKKKKNTTNNTDHRQRATTEPRE